MRILSGTGHRVEALDAMDWMAARQHMLTAIGCIKPDGIISGMATGMDYFLAVQALELGIPLHLANPFDGHRHDEYLDLIPYAASVTVVTPGPYAVWKYQKRNEWMVDHSQITLAVWNGSPKGGTRNCVVYARKVGQPIWMINPVTWDITYEYDEGDSRVCIDRPDVVGFSGPAQGTLDLKI